MPQGQLERSLSQVKRSGKACDYCRRRRIRCIETADGCLNCRKRKSICSYRPNYRSRSKPIIRFVPNQHASPGDGNSVQPTMNGNVRHDFSGLSVDGPSSHRYFLFKVYSYMKMHTPQKNAFKKFLEQPQLHSDLLSFPERYRSLELDHREMLHFIDCAFENFGLILALEDKTEYKKCASVLFSDAQRLKGCGKCSKLSLLYATISLGLSMGVSTSAKIRGIDNRVWLTLYTMRSQKLLPSMLDVFDVATVQAYLINSILLIFQAKNDSAFLLIGCAVRMAIILGLHNLDVERFSFDALHNGHRTWVACCVWESMIAIVLGRPSSIANVNVTPFQAKAYQSIGISEGHVRVRYLYVTRIVSRVLTIYNDSQSQSDILQVYESVRSVAEEMEQILGDGPKHLQITKLADLAMVNDAEFMEWFWIRQLYLQIKIIMMRPFLVFSMYFGGANLQEQQLSEEIRQAISYGCSECLEVAIAIPSMLRVVSERLETFQKHWFATRYVEPAAMILLFYVLTSPLDTSDILISRIRQALADACSYVEAESNDVPAVSQSRAVVADALDSLQSLRNSKDVLDESFLRSFFTPITSENFDLFRESWTEDNDSIEPALDAGDMEVENFWLQTLNYLGYS